MDSLCKEKSPIQEALAELKDISITPDQEKYKTFAEIYNPSYDQTPGFIAVPANTHDIKRCLQVAHKFGVPVAVKSGGHCFAGYSAIDSDGLLFPCIILNLSQEKMISLQLGQVQSGEMFMRSSKTRNTLL